MRSTDVGKQVDITGPVLVEIEVRDDGTVVYVHVDGFTVCRVNRVTSLIINDHRNKEQDRAGMPQGVAASVDFDDVAFPDGRDFGENYPPYHLP